MRKLLVTALALALCGCGYSGRDGEATGQAKKITHVTPLFCPDYYALDISLGVMRNGTGSMSTQDMWFTVSDVNDLPNLENAVAKAAVIRVRYDSRRFAFCTEQEIMTALLE